LELKKNILEQDLIHLVEPPVYKTSVLFESVRMLPLQPNYLQRSQL